MVLGNRMDWWVFWCFTRWACSFKNGTVEKAKVRFANALEVDLCRNVVNVFTGMFCLGRQGQWVWLTVLVDRNSYGAKRGKGPFGFVRSRSCDNQWPPSIPSIRSNATHQWEGLLHQGSFYGSTKWPRFKVVGFCMTV